MRVPIEIVNARRERLAELLRSHRFLPVQELQRRLDVSIATVRRDLAYLAENNILKRTYGGAMLHFERSFTSFADRRERAKNAKQAIAQRARKLISPGMVIFLDAGTTLYALAEAIAESIPRELTVITHNLAIAERLAEVPDVTIELTGGTLLRRQSILLGPRTLESVRSYEFDAAFLGAEALDVDGFWNTMAPVVEVQQAVLESAKMSYLCVDAGKIGHRTEDVVGDWKTELTLITDASSRQLREAEIDLTSKQIIRVNPPKGSAGS